MYDGFSDSGGDTEVQERSSDDGGNIEEGPQLLPVAEPSFNNPLVVDGPVSTPFYVHGNVSAMTLAARMLAHLPLVTMHIDDLLVVSPTEAQHWGHVNDENGR